MLLLLVRHGQTLGNIEERIQGDDDPLTDLGRRQARTLATHLEQRAGITHLYASPLIRALETASIIGDAVDLTPVVTPGLAEINAGHAAGQLWHEWRQANADLAQIMAQPDRPLTAGWAGGETGHEFGQRVIAAYDEIVTRHIGSDDAVVAVGHGGSLAWVAAKVFGDSLDRWPGLRGGFLNCSISEVRIDERGNAIPGAWNEVAHLDGVLED